MFVPNYFILSLILNNGLMGNIKEKVNNGLMEKIKERVGTPPAV